MNHNNNNNNNYRMNQNKHNNYRKKNNKHNNNTVSNVKKHKLNSSWSIYIHDIFEKDWTLESYKKVYTIHTIEDFWLFVNNFNNFHKCLFFVMRDDIKPVYEDEHNKNGGSYSYKVNHHELRNTFLYTCASMLCEQLNKTDRTLEINGISLVPKKNNCILKIWTKTKHDPVKIYINHKGLRNERFQPHKFY